MEKFVWNADYSVGIELIDKQHQHFFEIANEILDLASKKETRKETLFAYIEELGDYAFYHLGTEEKFFDEFKYEGAPQHRAAHDAFRVAVKDFTNAARNAATDIDVSRLSGAAADFTSNWLKNHILLIDKQYTVFFQEHGLR
jgi:hemerythrin